MYRTVLAAVDGSGEAFEAARHAANLADLSGATLHLLYVMETSPSYTRPGLSGLEDQIDESQRQHGEETLEEGADVADKLGVECVTEIKKGTPHQKILDYAEAIDADVIVLGPRGQRDLGDVLLGSTSERVVRNAKTTVSIAK